MVRAPPTSAVAVSLEQRQGGVHLENQHGHSVHGAAAPRGRRHTRARLLLPPAEAALATHHRQGEGTAGGGAAAWRTSGELRRTVVRLAVWCGGVCGYVCDVLLFN